MSLVAVTIAASAKQLTAFLYSFCLLMAEL